MDLVGPWQLLQPPGPVGGVSLDIQSYLLTCSTLLRGETIHTFSHFFRFGFWIVATKWGGLKGVNFSTLDLHGELGVILGCPVGI